MEETISMYVSGTSLHILYAGEKSVSLDLKSKVHVEVAEMVLADPNFWANFLNSFSTAINNHVESN